MRRTWIVLAAILAVLTTAAVACDDDDDVTDGPTATPPAEATPTPDEQETVQVFFLDEDNFVAGEFPYVASVERDVESPIQAGALDALFAGPTAEEEAEGLMLVASEATGFTGFQVADAGIARLQLTGGCDSGGSTFTVADQIIPTLKQFPLISYVKILDPDGNTAAPDGPSDSVPACLEP